MKAIKTAISGLTRTNCSRKVREIESGSWERWLGWRGWRMIICKRLDPPDDHLQEAGSSGWPFASGWSLQIIICKRTDPPDDHLQWAGPSRWSFASGRILWMIICKRPDSPDDHFQEWGRVDFPYVSVTCRSLFPRRKHKHYLLDSARLHCQV